MAKWNENSTWKAGLGAMLTGMILRAPKATMRRARDMMRHEFGRPLPWQLTRDQMLRIKAETGAEFYMPDRDRPETWEWSVETPKDPHLSTGMKHRIYRALVDADPSALAARLRLFDAVTPGVPAMIPPVALRDYSGVEAIDNLRRIVKDIHEVRDSVPPEWIDGDWARENLGAARRLLGTERALLRLWELHRGKSSDLPIGTGVDLWHGGTMVVGHRPGQLHEVFDFPRSIPPYLYSSEVPIYGGGGKTKLLSPQVELANRYMPADAGTGRRLGTVSGYMIHNRDLYQDPMWPTFLPVALSDLPFRRGEVNDPGEVVRHMERTGTHEVQHVFDSRQGVTLDGSDVPYRDRVQEIRARRATDRHELDPEARMGTLLNDDLHEDAKGGESADDLGEFISELPPDDDLGEFIFENRL